MKSTTILCCVTVLALGLVSGVRAQVNTINSVVFSPREYDDDPTSLFTLTDAYPSRIVFDDRSVDRDGASGGFANRHTWRFSNDNGASLFRLTNDSFFRVSMDVTLDGNVSPRKEAGFLFDTIGGQGQFIVNSDAREVVVFGGPLPFYRFGFDYTVGTTLRLGMVYYRGLDGRRRIIYQAGGLSSPPLLFTNLELGIIDNSTLGGYVQVVIDPNNPDNFASAQFQNITITPLPDRRMKQPLLAVQ